MATNLFPTLKQNVEHARIEQGLGMPLLEAELRLSAAMIRLATWNAENLPPFFCHCGEEVSAFDTPCPSCAHEAHLEARNDRYQEDF